MLEGNGYMEGFHDPIRHLKYLRQSLSQDNESIGFFLSAGCPLSVSMPTDEWPLIPDVANLTKFINSELIEDVQYKILLTELVKAERNSENIEDTLSFLRSLLTVSKGGDVRGLSETNLLDLEKKICKIIVKKIDVLLPNQETPYHQLCKWIRSIDRKTPVEIFTTNYDLLMEQSLEDLEVEYFDGFVGARRSFFDLRALEDNLIPVHWSRLWKIHGSINWYKEEISGQKKVYRSSEIKEDASHLIYPSHLKYEESRKMPYLALIDQLNRFIRKKSSLLIMSGYSFNDGHLNDTIINALKANPTAMVLALMYGNFEDQFPDGIAKEKYPEAYRLAKNQHNLNIWTFNKAIIGTNPGRWSLFPENDDADVDIRAFITSSKVDDTSDKTENIIKLGDFAVFTSFLKRIIGSTAGGS
ncbi:SIR2 family protein [Pseudomonas sp. MWU12-2312b]|nr:SIR2 family protein [Pseudomonas sp. MWU12-2312b]